MSDTFTWQYNAIDSVFFKEAREMDSSGVGEIDSLFPPPINTLIGATRTLIAETTLGDAMDWSGFSKEKEIHKAAALIGYGIDNLGPLSFKGVWLRLGGERLYPAPLRLLRKTCTSTGDNKYGWLTPGTDTIGCDLGQAVRLPQISGNMRGAVPVSDVWVTGTQFESLLAGSIPKDLSTLLVSRDFAGGAVRWLVHSEPRLGIARNNRHATVIEGLLYQTRHIRPTGDLAFEVDVCGSSVTSVPAELMTRFGGEGRAASVSLHQHIDQFPSLPDAGKASGLVLYLLTPALMRSNKYTMFPGFKRQSGTPTRWHGELNGVPMDLISAVIGKPLREGGWDAAEHAPRKVLSLTPAGSCFFIKPRGNLQQAGEALHGSQIGYEQKHGRGVIAVGYWNDVE